jgi:hypothetical protein
MTGSAEVASGDETSGARLALVTGALGRSMTIAAVFLPGCRPAVTMAVGVTLGNLPP